MGRLGAPTEYHLFDEVTTLSGSLERILIILQIVHTAARLDKHPGTASITTIRYRLPRTRHCRSAKSFSFFHFYEFLYMQEGTQLNSFQRTVTVLGDTDVRFTPVIFSHFIGSHIIVFRAVNKAHHVGILFDGTRLTKVTQLRHLVAILAFFHLTA